MRGGFKVFVSGAALVSPAPPRWITVLTTKLLQYQLVDLPTVLLGRVLHPS